MTAALLSRSVIVLLLGAPAWGEQDSAGKNLSEYARGVFANLNGNTRAARQHFEATLQKDPDSFPVARKTAGLQREDGDLSAAAGTLRSYAEAQPDHLISQLYYADFLENYAARDAVAQRAATKLLTEATGRFPHHHEVYTRLIHLHENLGQRDKSLALFQTQLEAKDAGLEHWMALPPIAQTLLPGGSPELQEALEHITEKTVETGVQIAMAARRASDYYRQTGRLGKAIGVLQKHLELQPDSLDLRTRLGLLQLYDKQEKAALRTLQETLQIDPHQTLAHKALSQFYARNGNPDKSLHHRAEVLRIAGGAPDDFLQLADQFLELKKPHLARLILEKARFDHPEHPALAARLAIATLRDGDPAAASRLFRQAEALARDSGHPSARDVLDAGFQIEFAGALRQTGDRASAENRLRHAIRAIPPGQPGTSAHALRELARLWIDGNKNFAPAASLLKRAETLEPGHPETRRLLEKTQRKTPSNVPLRK